MLFMPGRRETEKKLLVDVKEVETKIKMYILYIVRQMLRVAVKTKEATLVANVKQYAVMRAMQNEEYQELHEVIEYMDEWQGKLLATMERKQKLVSAAPEHLRGKIFQEHQGLG